MSTTFIAGASRGIGLEIVNQLSREPSNTVIVSARNPTGSTELQALAAERSNIKIITLDNASEESIAQLDGQLTRVAPEGLDTVILNAGIMQAPFKVSEAPRDVWLKHYVTNVLGPIEVYKVAYPHLLKKSTRQLVFISSVLGSITNYIPFSSSAYGQSKAALNYTIKELSFELKDDKATVLAIHPGLVGTQGAMELVSGVDTSSLQVTPITPEESVTGVLQVLKRASSEDSGKFFNYQGGEEPY